MWQLIATDEACSDCSTTRPVTFLSPPLARRGRRVFGDGDEVSVELLHDGKTIYCATAESTWYPGAVDYVSLKNFSELDAS
jgi:hypothetical protein